MTLLFFFFFQGDGGDGAAANLDPGATAAPEESGKMLYEYILDGGVIMIPLFIMLVLALYFFTERILVMRRSRKDPEEMLAAVKRSVLDGDIERAKSICAEEDTPMSRMIGNGLGYIGSSIKNIETAIENTGKIEVNNLEKNVAWIAMISGAAPMIGFFGTVIGMIGAFGSLSSDQEGGMSSQALADNISVAMVTTAGGLFVGIIAYVAYNYLVGQISRIIAKMQATSIEFMELLQRPS